ncbi:hypothetical protein GGR57DRAFT_445609 [Xylariaceae sp. FL1272]|nr:hypothetical protein GGR57DRAFT_445609 [Xylariaceae sp. FL1272]
MKINILLLVTMAVSVFASPTILNLEVRQNCPAICVSAWFFGLICILQTDETRYTKILSERMLRREQLLPKPVTWKLNAHTTIAEEALVA